MIVPKTTDLVALKNATLGQLVVIGGDPECRRPSACTRKKEDDGYQLPWATPVSASCPLWLPPTATPTTFYLSGFTWTHVTACTGTDGRSAKAYAWPSLPATIVLPSDPTTPCQWLLDNVQLYSQRWYTGTTCGGSPTADVTPNLQVIWNATFLQVAIVDNNNAVSVWSATGSGIPLSSPFDVTLSADQPSYVFAGVYTPSVRVTDFAP